MKQQNSPEIVYGGEDMQRQIDLVDLQISHEKNNIERNEALKAEITAKQEAARKMLEFVSPVLAMSHRPGLALNFQAEAISDKRLAEAALTVCAERLAVVDELLQSAKNRLSHWTVRRAEFDQDAIRSSRELQELRNRIRSR